MKAPNISLKVPETWEPKSIETFIRTLTLWVSDILSVPERPISVRLVQDGEAVARTLQNWPPDTPVMWLSPDCLKPDVIAHEIAHCLVPSRWLFFAEGIATWAGCVAGGHCRHLLFEDSTLEHLLCRSAGDLPEPRSLFGATVGAPYALDPEAFFRREVRLAHAVAGSFCRFMIRQFPEFPRTVLNRPDDPPEVLLARVAASHMDHLEACWLREVRKVGLEDADRGETSVTTSFPYDLENFRR